MHKQGSPMIIFIHSPHCGHCRTYEPEWDEHYNKFPHYSINHKDARTPSIGSISVEELLDVPIPVRSGLNTRQLREFVDVVPKIVSLDREGHLHPIPNIRNFDGIGEILREMNVKMSGGYLYEQTPSKSMSKSMTYTTRNISKKKKKNKNTKDKSKRKTKKKKKGKGNTRNKRCHE